MGSQKRNTFNCVTSTCNIDYKRLLNDMNDCPLLLFVLFELEPDANAWSVQEPSLIFSPARNQAWRVINRTVPCRDAIRRLVWEARLSRSLDQESIHYRITVHSSDSYPIAPAVVTAVTQLILQRYGDFVRSFVNLLCYSQHNVQQR